MSERQAAKRSRHAAAVAAIVVGLTACAATSGSPGSVSNPSASTRAVTLAKLTFGAAPLPVGFDQPTTLTGDSLGVGVYFLAESPTDARVFHWDGQALRSWSIGDPAQDRDLVSGIQNSIAAGRDATVWVGLNNTLIALDTSTGEVKTMVIPALTASNAADDLRPTNLRGWHPILALALAPGGDLAVIRGAALDVTVRDHASGKFAQVPVSSSTQPASIAYDQSGTLAVSSYAVSATKADLSAGTLQLLRPGANAMTAPASTSGGTVMARPNGGFILVSSLPAFTAITVSADGVQTPQRPIQATAQLAVQGPSAVVSTSVVALGTTTGFALFDMTSGAEQDLNFPTSQCDPNGAAIPLGPSPVSRPTSVVCGSRALALSVDSTGTLWSLTSGPGAAIAQVRS
jgi:hypothetical protein